MSDQTRDEGEGRGRDESTTRGAPPENHDGDQSRHDHNPDVAGGSEAALATPASSPAAPPLTRRRALAVLGAIPLASALGWSQQQGTGQQQGQQAPKQTHEGPHPPATGAPQPASNAPRRRFFTAREHRIVTVLADDVIPRDARSGSATDAGVPAFIDYHLSVPETTEDTRIAWRGGLRWLDTESRRRFRAGYASARRAQRHAILDDIAYPDKAPAELRHGVAFFNRFRDMCGAGFFSSAMGWKDLQYMGHTFVPVWQGCPEPALKKLAVSYDVMNTRTPPK